VDRIRSKKMKVGTLDIRYLYGGEGDPLVVIHGCGHGAICMYLSYHNSK
jgi:hypothetical protein